MMMTIMGFNANHLKVFIVAVVLATAFFAHETIISTTTAEEDARLVWKNDKKQRTIDLEKLIESTKGTDEYKTFMVSSKKTNISHNKLTGIKKKAEFLGFKSFRLFVGEFDWALGVFLFAFVSLLRSIFKNGTNKENIKTEFLFYAPFMFVGIFYMSWCFMSKDYNKAFYILANIGCFILVLLAAFYFIKQQQNSIQKHGKKSILHLLGLVSDIRVNHYTKMSVFAENTVPKEIIETDRNVLDEKIENTLADVVNDIGLNSTHNN